MKKILSKLTAVIVAISVLVMGMSIPVAMAGTETTASTFTGENLLADYDPGFEGTAVSSKWGKYGTSTVSVSTEQKHSGNQSLKIVVNKAQDMGISAPNSLLKNGKTYYVSAWLYVPANGLYRIRATGKESWRQCYTGWNHIREVVTHAGDTNPIRLQNATGATYTGTVYLDDVMIMEIDNTNLLSAYDPDFENTTEYPAKDSGNTYWNVRAGVVTSDATQKKSGSKAVKVVRDGLGQQVGLVAKDVKVEKGKTYYASAWVYSAKEIKYRLRFQDNASSANLPQTSWETVPKRWTCLGAVIECKGDDTAAFYVQAADKGTSGDIVYIDNFELYDFTPPAPETATVVSPLNGAAKVSVDTDLKLVFTQEIPSLGTSNIVIEGVTVGQISSTDNKSFTIDLGTLTPNTSYTVKVTGVVDVNGNTVEDTTFTFTTAHAGYENLLITQGYDAGFETGLENYSLKGTVKQTDAKKHTGSYSALSTDRQAEHYGAQAFVDLEENTEYLLAAWVYTDAASVGVKMRAQGADQATIPGYTVIEAGKWNYVSAIMNTTGANAADSGQTNHIDHAMFMPQINTNEDVWVDDYEVVKIGRIPDSDKYVFDNVGKQLTLYKVYTDKYADMDDIAADIIGASDYNISVTDTDGSGDWTTGDKLILTSKTAGAEYAKTYTAEVRDYYYSSTEALIVKGSDGIGDDFSHGSTITKSGDALVEYRVENNSDKAVTPVVIVAVYDDDGDLTDVDIESNIEVPVGEYKDFELDVEIPSALENGNLKIMVWSDFDSVDPLLNETKEYTINTNEFSVPNIIADNMILQRNATATVFGKAPEGATVTAALSGGITGNYTVPQGDNEFFVPLEMGEYSTTEQTLTISAVDAEGRELGSVTKTGVLVGDVYYGSGQSNMARQFVFTADAIKDGKSSIYTPDQYNEYVAEYKAIGAELSNKNVRFYKTMTEDTSASRASKGEETLAKKEVWRTVDEDNIDDTYNVMVRMAANIKSMDEYKDVPIGIVACAQGGTIAAKWVSRDTLFNAGFDKKELDEYEKNITRADSQWYWASHTDLYYDGARAVLPYTFKAAVWYQGQSDTSLNYDRYIAGVIHDIRESQKNDELPVLVLGLFGVAKSDYTSCWSVQRLCQLNAANQLTNVYTTITNDTGDAACTDPFHPANDADVALRAARSMLANVYRKQMAWEGPKFTGTVTYGTGSAVITVNTNGGTLNKYDSTSGSPIFEVTANGGETWTSADSISIDGDKITVKDSDLTATVNGVRYAMTPLTVKCIYGTYNDEFGTNVALPLIPFDTTYTPNTLTYK